MIRLMRKLPVLTCLLIGSCCLLFALSPQSGLLPSHGTGSALRAARQAYFERWGVLPREVRTGSARALLTPLTALFLHANWPHLLGNMLFLYVFGGPVERRMGPSRFALFYLGAGYVSLLTHALAYPASGQTVIGASGAVSGVLGGFLYLFPRARVTSLFPFLLYLPLRFPAWLVLVFWLAVQWAAAREQGGGPGVAHLAHVAGFTLGFLYAWRRFRTARLGRARVREQAQPGDPGRGAP